ncbi:hypothetical protein [Streptomyces sp. NPDC091215]|uniref:hypothetical protein n=1 Tax=Streptomyces sp. NPDC091215 TaxID=3155192 RepID=UPI00343317AC
MWLWWTGPPGHTPDPDLLWRAYTRRFDIEHTFRFARQTLNWTLPRPRTPEQADRWTWLIIAAYTQLRLARTLVADHRLPWEKPLPLLGSHPVVSADDFVTFKQQWEHRPTRHNPAVAPQAVHKAPVAAPHPAIPQSKHPQDL